MDDAKFFAIAVEEARAGFEEGGVPVRFLLPYAKVPYTLVPL